MSPVVSFRGHTAKDLRTLLHDHHVRMSLPYPCAIDLFRSGIKCLRCRNRRQKPVPGGHARNLQRTQPSGNLADCSPGARQSTNFSLGVPFHPENFRFSVCLSARSLDSDRPATLCTSWTKEHRRAPDAPLPVRGTRRPRGAECGSENIDPRYIRVVPAVFQTRQQVVHEHGRSGGGRLGAPLLTTLHWLRCCHDLACVGAHRQRA